MFGSVLASLWNEVFVKDSIRELQDTNDFVMANMQRRGQYSVISRVPGGEITPQELILLVTVALKYNLWTKITGAQRIRLSGANIWQLPDIWEDITYGRSFSRREAESEFEGRNAAMESGQAYGKAFDANAASLQMP